MRRYAHSTSQEGILVDDGRRRQELTQVEVRAGGIRYSVGEMHFGDSHFRNVPVQALRLQRADVAYAFPNGGKRNDAGFREDGGLFAPFSSFPLIHVWIFDW